MIRYALSGLMLSLVVGLTGCGNKGNTGTEGSENYPVFTLAWSEYPSWSVFGVAQEKGLLGKSGTLGELEKKYKVRIELKLVDYDTCLTMYGSNTVDAVCMTNMDSLNPSFGRKSTAILPTSTSFGADALVAVGIDTPEQLKNVPVYGLEKSVSEYAFVRALQKQNLNPADYKFVNMDPGAAAQALQTNQKGIQAIMVWNPFVLQTLRTRKDSKKLFDSSLIPGEIVDMVVMGNDSLAKPSGEDAAKCIAEAYYTVSNILNGTDSKAADEAYIALGAKFSNLGLDDMKLCCKQTRFYGKPKEGVDLFDSKQFAETMKVVSAFCVDRKIIEKPADYGFNNPSKNLNFTTQYMK